MTANRKLEVDVGATQQCFAGENAELHADSAMGCEIPLASIVCEEQRLSMEASVHSS